uniref:Uncharacterized protein n=1 Tax=Anguilla anguilla TaxID=7936 RepID=A0A0E9XQ82_ANGAN
MLHQVIYVCGLNTEHYVQKYFLESIYFASTSLYSKYISFFITIYENHLQTNFFFLPHQLQLCK